MRSQLAHRIWKAAAAAALAVLLAFVVVLLAFPHERAKADRDDLAHLAFLHRPRGAPAPAAVPARVSVAQAQVTLASGGGGAAVPRSFLGLSTEYWWLPLYAQHPQQLAAIASLLHVPGDGPFVLRIGGDSADRSFWQPQPKPLPSWMYTLTPSWVRDARVLVEQMHARLILDLNLVTGSPSGAGRWAQAAEAGLPPGTISAFEVGNEPDLYEHWYWRTLLTGRSRIPLGLLPHLLTPADYTADYGAYARVLRKVAPRTPLAGPVIANPARDFRWVERFLAAPHPRLGIVTAHRYPYSECVPTRSRVFPTVARVLSQYASAGVAEGIAAAVRLAHRAGLPFRLTELNSVTCGGLRGVSNTFATALWAADTLFELARVGADGVNIHTRADAINAPFAFGPQGLEARPLLYGMALFTRALGVGARLLGLHVRGGAAANLKVWAVHAQRPAALHVLMIDKGPRPVVVALRIGGGHIGRLERLQAPSVSADSAVTLAGQQIGPDGRWVGRRIVSSVTPSRGVYRVAVPAYSAALLSVGGGGGGGGGPAHQPQGHRG